MQATELRGQKDFAIQCYELGDCGSCMLSWFLPCVAVAYARGHIDNSAGCVNACCLNPILLRFVTRSAYNIQGDWVNDILCGLCCTPCSINQSYQTAVRYGPASPDGGFDFNTRNWIGKAEHSCGTMCYALCCTSCAVGTLLERSLGVPWLMGCCCANVCIARNLTRYQYRVAGEDCKDECCIPVCVFIAGYLACSISAILPCCICCALAVWPYLASLIVTPLEDSSQLGNLGHYLGPLPAQPMYVVQPGQPVYIQQPGQPLYVQQQGQPVYVQQQGQPVYVQQQGQPTVYTQQPAVYQQQPVVAQSAPTYEMTTKTA